MTDQPDDDRPADPAGDTGALNMGYRDAEGRLVSSSDATQVVARASARPAVAEETPQPGPDGADRTQVVRSAAPSDPGAADRTQVVPRGPAVPSPDWGAAPQHGSAPQGYAPPPQQGYAPQGQPPPQGFSTQPQGYAPQPQGHPQQGYAPQQQQGYGPAQQGYGPPATRPTAPMQPGWGRLVVDTSFFPLAFILYLFGPLVTVDGQERARTWGRASVDVPAGQHRVDVLTRYLFPVARASLDVVVQPGQEVPVYYRTPAIVFMSGAIGHVPQKTKGLVLTVLVPLAVLALVVVVVVVAAVAANL